MAKANLNKNALSVHLKVLNMSQSQMSEGMWFCISVPNLVQIGWSSTKLWRHIDFTRWRT